jgi:hypothetical protein
MEDAYKWKTRLIRGIVLGTMHHAMEREHHGKDNDEEVLCDTEQIA